MTTDTQRREFAKSLRRILYLIKIIDYNIEDMRMMEVTPGDIKMELNSIRNACNRFLTTSRRKTTPENWEQVNGDISKDTLHDISLLLDAVSDVSNVATIVEVINDLKAEKTAA